MFSRLFIFEMANNHMGDVEHGLKIIRELRAATASFNFKFAVKFQYRDLDTFIHQDYRNRQDIKYIKRFSETRLAEVDFLQMKDELHKLGFLSICTPFDEKSVDMVEKHGFEIIKIASCSLTDWPLLERIAATGLPLIASTAGATIEEIDRVVTFFEHRRKTLCLMHCVGSYPTPEHELEMNQIDLFKARYKPLPIGFSTHEAPGDLDPIKIAIAKGAVAFERHVGVANEKYKLNDYSSSPAQIAEWLKAAEKAYSMCGVSGKRRDISEKEHTDISGLRRGVFCRQALPAGTKLSDDDVFYAIPCVDGQLQANDMSKYMIYSLKNALPANSPVLAAQTVTANIRDKVLEIIKAVCALIKKSNLKLQDKLELELSHHYGIDNFYRHGCTIITCVNREYCKKIILLLPGQTNPDHSHKVKEETFHVLYGELTLSLDDDENTYNAGDIIVVERNKKHRFASETGAVLEEISTTHIKDDSYYEDDNIAEASERKTYMTFHADWLSKTIQ
ncbi:MAG: cupin domain-containing protein [Lentisphaerae bacterium]|nr:cupin domain-containing protein [Lentisphaerota bacterium]